jgi:hypothetical protein
VHGGGSQERDLPGARAHRSSAAVARDKDGDEVQPRGCSPEHRRWRRGGTMMVENDGSAS